MRPTLRACTAIACLSAAAQAQVVRGRAVGADSAGVPGVIVLLVDPAGRVAARALTGERGEYRITAAGAGDYALRTLRIGYRPSNAPGLALAAGQEVERDITLDAVAFTLDTVRVASRARCAPYDSASVVAAVWQQARTALTAAQLTAGDLVFGATMIRHERAVDARSRQERLLFTKREAGFVSRGWTSLSADSLHRGGYVHQLADGTNSWFAPDLDVLLSDRFLTDHCFRLARAAGMLGVRFEPARERRVPEIEGTLWLELRTGDLQRMDFRYVNVPFAERGEPGGDIEFVRLANGGRAIARWSIRMPVFAERQRPSSGVPGDAPRTERVHVETRIASGELALVTRGTDTLYHAGVVVARARPVGLAMDPIAVSPPPARPADTTRPAVPLPAVTASAPAVRGEFEQRRRLGGGTFLTREDFEKWPARKLPDFMANVQGARLASANGAVWVTSGRGATATLREPERRSTFPLEGRRACYADVWLDGVHVYGRKDGEPLFDITRISPRDLEGVEFYPSTATAPAKYTRSGAECGVLLLWTRQPSR